MKSSTSTGQQLAIFGAQMAADRADRVTGGSWSAEAWAFFTQWAQTRKGEPFQGEDVRLAALGTVPAAPDARAWGHILQRAARTGLIRRVGYAPVKDPRSHHCPKSVWQWGNA